MKLKILAAFLICGSLACSEDFLIQEPQGAYTPNSLANAAGVDGLLIATYAALDGLWFETWGNNQLSQSGGASNWIWGSIRSEEAYKGTEPADFVDINPIERYETQPSLGVLMQKWRGSYDGIGKANETLRVLALAREELSDADFNRIGGEARFLRGHFHFEAAKVFGNPPFVDETVGTVEGIPFNEVTNDGDIMAAIVADLQFAVDNLPETQNAGGRANKTAARAMLGKAYLYMGEWSNAKAQFDQVVNGGVTADGDALALEELFLDNFNASAEVGNTEGIFAYEASATGDAFNGNYENTLNQPHNSAAATASGGASSGCCGFFQPTQTFVNAFQVNDDGLPLDDWASSDTRNNEGIADDEDFDAFGTMAGEMVDPRLDWTVGRRGIPYLDWDVPVHPGLAWIRDVTNGGPYSPIKNVPRLADRAANLGGSFGWGYTLSALNVHIIRYADVLLMLAEAEAELGNDGRALELLNMIRMRASNPDGFVMLDGAPAANYMVSTYDGLSGSDLIDAIRFERLLELGMEGHRFFDLVRWDNVSESGKTGSSFDIADYINNTFLANETERGHLANATFQERHKYAPIPEFVITQSTVAGVQNIKQNEGF